MKAAYYSAQLSYLLKKASHLAIHEGQCTSCRC